MRKKWLLSLGLILLVIFMAACNGDEEDTAEDSNEGEEQEQEQEATDDPMGLDDLDVDDVPEVIAEVNGDEISRDEFMNTYVGQYQQAMMQSQMTGEEVDQEQLKQEVADALIGQQLVIQEAERQGFEASEEEIEETIDELLAQSGAESREELFAALEEQGMTEDEIISQVETQIKVDELIANEAGDLEPTEEELEELYENYVVQMEEMQGEDAEIPTYEELEPQLTQQAVGDKETEAYLALVEQLEADAEITNHL
ncbi:SurA N-terminal domain-containing protein [Virgibacillus kimchii]